VERVKVRWIWWVLVILWCIQIFYFTALPVYNDEHTRGFLVRLLTDVFPKDSVGITVIDYLIRKTAHVTVFGILAILFKMAINIERRQGYLLAWALTAFYAGTDEWHQAFVPGRTSSVYDVMIDSAGALIFLLCLFSWNKTKRKFQHN
jgi:VanZ family protein